MARPVAIEVRNVHKEFRIPARSQPSARAGLTHPLRRSRGRQLRVLDEISFDVHAGEFFAVVGRNGSGKSTLLKMLASIYRADRGTIRIAGRLAPFLELGVGFNADLTAYDNIVINGVMMGLPAKEAKARYGEIVEFAGLEDYTDLKLKNYSSGMKVRLGFAVMTHVEADVLLIDEVLAVGDAEFQEKCGEVFRTMHAEGRTIILVTHSMDAVSAYCERAMLIDAGRVAAIGEPQEVADRYLEVNLRAAMARSGPTPAALQRLAAVLADPPVRIEEAWLQDAEGHRIETVGAGEPIELHAVVAIDREVHDPGFGFQINDPQGGMVFRCLHEPLADSTVDPITPGARFGVKVAIRNYLAAGHYVLFCGVNERRSSGSPQPVATRQFVNVEVRGELDRGVVALDYDVVTERREDQEMVRG